MFSPAGGLPGREVTGVFDIAGAGGPAGGSALPTGILAGWFARGGAGGTLGFDVDGLSDVIFVLNGPLPGLLAGKGEDGLVTVGGCGWLTDAGIVADRFGSACNADFNV